MVAARYPTQAPHLDHDSVFVEKTDHKTWLKLAGIVLIAILITGSFVTKHFFKSKPTEAIDAKTAAEAGNSDVEWTLPRKEGGMLLVKCLDGGAVAQICAGQLRWPPEKRLDARTISLSSPIPNQTEFLIYPEFNGCVRVGLPCHPDSKGAAAFMELAQLISEKQRTRVVMVITEKNTEQGEYAVYENGARRFLSTIRYTTSSRTTPERTRGEGSLWLSETGFQLDVANLEKFTMIDANKLTLFLGLNAASAPENSAVVALMIVPVR